MESGRHHLKVLGRFLALASTVLVLVIALQLTAARAASRGDGCRTYRQAKVAYPDQRLSYWVSRRKRCWYGTSPRRPAPELIQPGQVRVAKKNPLPGYWWLDLWYPPAWHEGEP